MQKLAKDQDCTILLVTHDNRILDIADCVIHMEDGRLVSDFSRQMRPLLGVVNETLNNLACNCKPISIGP